MFTRSRFPFKVVYRKIDDEDNELIIEDVRWFENEEEFNEWLQRAEKLGKIGKHPYHYEIVSKEWEVVE